MKCQNCKGVGKTLQPVILRGKSYDPIHPPRLSMGKELRSCPSCHGKGY